ncbi:hypothetical protein TWF506_002621 [Arthrobotrys conoides]|uniref:F-box domain-containing protein n=1 Tax=Arthrobotrys conoides TaxID=74498 RepID=A0AAN8N5C1_9PEZI
MKILSLPNEILIQIFDHLPWLDHFTLSTVSPIFATILHHHTPFRRKRYCEEIWYDSDNDNDNDKDDKNKYFRRFDPDEVRYWPGGPGWRSELGLHGLLASGRFFLKLEKGGKRTDLLSKRVRGGRRKVELEEELEGLDPMMRALETHWSGLSMVEISMDLLAEDRQYLKGGGLDTEASFERNCRQQEEEEEEDGEEGEGEEEGEEEGSDSSRKVYSHIGTLDFVKSGNNQGDAVEQSLRTGQTSVYDIVGKYPQIFRIKHPVYFTDEGEKVCYFDRGSDRYWTIHLPWDGPGSSVKDVIDAVAAGFTKEILDRNEGILGCWIKFCQYSFFPTPDNLDTVHPRWKIFLDVLVVK